MNTLQSTTNYFLTEGRANMESCLRVSFARALSTGIHAVVIFTANGEGLEFACKELLGQPQYHDLRVIGVSVPFGVVSSSAIAIPEERSRLLEQFNIPIIRAASPLDDPVNPSGLRAIRKTLEIFSGGMALCVWGALVACDAGTVMAGEHIISCCADTSILVKAVPSAQFLTAFAVREIVCKPLIHDLSKREAIAEQINAGSLSTKSKPIVARKQLPESSKE